MAKAVKYISIQELAEISGKEKRTLQRWCNQGKVQYRTVKAIGGTRYEILISSLDKKLQDLVFFNYATGSDNTCTHTITPAAGFLFESKTAETVKKDFNVLCVQNESTSCALTEQQKETLSFFGLDKIAEQPRILPESEKKKALIKVDLIHAFQEFRNNCTARKTNKTEADKTFVELYNNGFIHQEIYKKLGAIGLSTLYRYEKTYEESNHDYYTLIPNYSYGCESRLQSSLTPIEKYLLLKYMLHQNRFSLGAAYQLINVELKNMGEIQHSYSAYRNLWKYLNRNYYPHIVYAREGLKACKDKALPYLERDYSKIEFAQWIVGDGHTLDFMVQNPFNGKPCRATLVAFLDVATEDLAGYDIMLTENTQSIASALRNAIIYMGKKPEWVQLDNGRAFKSSYFTSVKGLYEKLGIKTYFSKAYNGRAKIVERFFKEFTESYAKLWNTYIGNGINNKPAHTKRNEKKHVQLAGEYVPTIEEVRNCIEAWLNNFYRQRPCCKDNRFTIAEYVEQMRGQGVNIDELDDLMMAEEVRKIQRNGVKLFDRFYWNEKLFGLFDSCVIKYSYFDLSYVKVYSLSGEYICRAERTTSVNALVKASDDPKDYEEYKYQSRNLANIEKSTTSPMNKILKQMYCTKPKHSYTPAPPMLEDKYIKQENIIDVEPVEDDDYKLDTAFFGKLLAEKQADKWAAI